jgi:hypothetical protein
VPAGSQKPRQARTAAEEALKIPVKYLDADDVSRIYGITRGKLWPMLLTLAFGEINSLVKAR